MPTADELLSAGTALRFATIGTYAGAFVGYAASLAVKKARIALAATVLAVIGVTAHTAYLASRWLAAGQIEIAAREATGDVLTAADRFWFLVSHPPYTNLFDALNFTGWALMICYLVVQRRWGLHVVGALTTAVALVTMGEASLVADQGIEPLVPALQSYWILIHVAMLFVSYALFTIGAAASLLFLVRSGTKTTVLGAAQAGVAALLLCVTGGSALLTRASFQMAPSWTQQVPSRLRPGKMLQVTSAAHQIVEGKQVKLMLDVPGVGPFLLAAAVLLAAGAVVYFLRRQRETDRLGFALVAAGFAALTSGLGVLVYRIATADEALVPPDVLLVSGERGPFRFGFASNYSLGLVALLWGTTLGFLITALVRNRISSFLPDPRRLEDITYRMVIAGWPLLTVGIVMGGVWANEAWGRFWGWDPKETWALITWIVYAGYLHTRITLGWTGKRTAAIAVAAFAVVVFTFMGVNLGLTGDGLHTYGSG
jgi:ABC-type transport system involved in cytochrome c biogenesis permease subunit